MDANTEITGKLMYAELEGEAVLAEQTLGVDVLAREEAEQDAFVARWLRRRAEAVEQGDEVHALDRATYVQVLRDEADLLEQRVKRTEGPASA
ncbi:hypothetical protein [Streptomyces werraensis]|uniref:hypothetical protein n=1 Tax=Streptomyces werraensis TaxID=68284 RepID=UPI00343EFE36